MKISAQNRGYNKVGGVGEKCVKKKRKKRRKQRLPLLVTTTLRARAVTGA